MNEVYLRAITILDSKNRYKIEEIDGVLMMRANQGHSMKSLEAKLI